MRICLVFFLLIVFHSSYSQARNEGEAFIIHPDFNVNRPLSIVGEGIKGAGLVYTKKVTSEGAKYLHVNTGKYEIAYYYNEEDITQRIRIVDEISKLRKWQEFYRKKVAQRPNLWKEVSDFQFQFENPELKTKNDITIMRNFESKTIIIDIK